MKDKVRFGVVGLVHDHVWPVWGEGYLGELIDLPEADLVACADANTELLERAARTMASRVFTWITARWLRERLDAVLMALPNDESRCY